MFQVAKGPQNLFNPVNPRHLWKCLRLRRTLVFRPPHEIKYSSSSWLAPWQIIWGFTQLLDVGFTYRNLKNSWTNLSVVACRWAVLGCQIANKNGYLTLAKIALISHLELIHNFEMTSRCGKNCCWWERRYRSCKIPCFDDTLTTSLHHLTLASNGMHADLWRSVFCIFTTVHGVVQARIDVVLLNVT